MNVLNQITTIIDVMADIVKQQQPWLPCRKGCHSYCCHNSLFAISDAEGERVRVAITKLPRYLRRKINKRAMEQIVSLKRRVGQSDDWKWLLTDQERVEVTCPLLENGACAIYEDRPIICRLYGWGETSSLADPYGCPLTTAAIKQYGKPVNLIDVEQLYQGVAQPFADLHKPIAAWVID